MAMRKSEAGNPEGKRIKDVRGGAGKTPSQERESLKDKRLRWRNEEKRKEWSNEISGRGELMLLL